MFTLNCKGRLLVIDKPVIMGIINVTPDSFYAGSRFSGIDAILEQAGKMVDEGATILDIGGQSTRPGSEQVPVEAELQRVVDPVKAIHRRFPEAFISIDTFYGKVASECVAAGASIVNDVSAGAFDTSMTGTVARLHVPYVLMHMKGTPASMQHDPQYDNVTSEVLDFLVAEKSKLARKGIHDIIADPGFGFGKTTVQNFELLNNLGVFGMLKSPVLAGFSRKGMVYRTLGTTPEEAVNGTTAINSFALMNGASILRVHDVKAAKEAITLYNAMKSA